MGRQNQMEAQAQKAEKPKGTVAVAGDGYLLKSVRRNPTQDVIDKKNCLMKISGDWYDVADFLDKHPGGDILKEYVGKDITVLYRMWHPTFVFNNPGKIEGVRKVDESQIRFRDDASASSSPVARDGEESQHVSKSRSPKSEQYVLASRPAELVAADKDYLEMYKDVERRGFFKGSQKYLNERFAILALWLTLAIYCFHGCTHFLWHVLGAFSMFEVWYQCAALMHDSCHNQYYNGQIKKNERLMFWSATIGVGISSSFWKWEHVEHHSFENTFDPVLGNADPQQTEDLWVHDKQLLPFYEDGVFHRTILKIQHAIFMPVLIVLGRIGITIDSFVTETRPYEFAGYTLHVAWVCLMLSGVYQQFGLLYAVFCYLMAGGFFSILEFQLMSNHMDKPWIEKLEEFDPKNGRPLSHIQRHIRACTNIEVPRWLDAYWGGLQFHMEHHCFPRMAREHYRRFAPEMQAFCKKHGYEYYNAGFVQTMASIISKLHDVQNGHRQVDRKNL